MKAGMNCREDLPIDRALEDFVAQTQLLEDEFFIEPVIPEPVDLTDLVEPYEEPYVQEVAADPTLAQATIPACIPQRTLVVSMMATAAMSALAVVWLYRPAPAPAIAAAAIPRIEVTLPRVVPQATAPAPTVTQLPLTPVVQPLPAPAPIARQLAAPPPAARAKPVVRKRTLTAKVSRREWSNGFAD
jgi:hypothetical protein